MATETRERICTILDAIRADFPRRKKAAEELMKQHGLKKSMGMVFALPDAVVDLPTFDPKVSRELTPMLKARFDYVGSWFMVHGSWKMGQEVWLSRAEMASRTNDKNVLTHHLAKREHWEGSAPMVFSDDCLTLFGTTESVPEDAIYLAWATEGVEPEVWVYEGFDCHKFQDLEKYLTWCLERQ